MQDLNWVRIDVFEVIDQSHWRILARYARDEGSRLEFHERSFDSELLDTILRQWPFCGSWRDRIRTYQFSPRERHHWYRMWLVVHKSEEEKERY